MTRRKNPVLNNREVIELTLSVEQLQGNLDASLERERLLKLELEATRREAHDALVEAQLLRSDVRSQESLIRELRKFLTEADEETDVLKAEVGHYRALT